MNAIYRLNVIIQTIDRLTGPIQGMVQSVERLERMAARGRSVADYGQRITMTGLMVNEAAGMMKQATSDLLSPAVAVDDAMTQLRTVTTTTMGSIQRSLDYTKKKSIEWSKVHADTADEYLRTSYIIAGANLNDMQTIAGTEAALRAAKATMADTAGTADLLATSYLNFGNKSKDVSTEMNRLADTLTKTQQIFKIKNLDVLNEGLKYGAPAAKEYKISFEELNAVVGMLNNVGLDASSAGTALSAAMRQIIPASKELGFQIARTSDGGVSFIGTLENIRKKFGDFGSMSDEMKVKFQKAFGDEGKRAISLLSDKTTDLNKALLQIKDSAGVAAQVQKDMESSSTQQYAIMQNNISAAKIALSAGLLPELNKLFPSIIKIVHSKNPKALKFKALFF